MSPLPVSVFEKQDITGANCCPVETPRLTMSWQPLIPCSFISPHGCHCLFALLFCQDFPAPFGASKNMHKSIKLSVRLLCLSASH